VLALLVAVDDITLVNRRTALCQRIEQLYRASADGTVYCDIPSRDFCYDDHDAMYSYNGWTISMQQRLWLSQGDPREFHWRPLAMRELAGKDLPSQVIDAGQNTYLLIANHRDSVCQYRASFIRNIYGLKLHGDNLMLRSDQVTYGFPFDIADSCFNACILRNHGGWNDFTGARLVATHVNP